MAELVPPYRGVGDQRPYCKTPGDSVPPDAERNVRRHASSDGVDRIGPRFGLTKAAGSLPGSVQRLLAVGVAAGATFSTGTAITLTGGAQIPNPTGDDTTRGCCFFVHPTLGLAAQLEVPGGTYTTSPGLCVAFSDNTDTEDYVANGAFCAKATKAYGGAIGSKTISLLSYWTSTTGTQTGGAPIRPQIAWTSEIEDKAPGGSVAVGALSMEARAVVVYEPYVLVAVNKYVYVFASQDIPAASVVAGQYLKRYDMNGWAWSVEALTFTYHFTHRDTPYVNPDSYQGNSPHMQVWYRGTPTISGPVTTSTYSEGSYFRSGMALFQIDPDNPTEPLVWKPNELPEDGDEGSRDWRFNYISTAKRGRVPFCFKGWKGRLRETDGSGTRTLPPYIIPDRLPFFGVTTNDGFGPNDTVPPNGGNGYFNAFQLRYDPSGVFDNDENWVWWKINQNSRFSNWLASGWYNDIPFAANGDWAGESSLTSVALEHARVMRCWAGRW